MTTTTPRLLFCCLLASMAPSGAAVAQTANTLSAKEVKNGWTLLFDGKSTAGWTTPSGQPVPAGWVVKAGTLTAEKGAKGGDIISVNQYANFELQLDYNLEPGGNSGLKYFYTTYESGGKLGLEYQLLDDQLAEDNKQENHLTGSLYDVLPPNAALKKTAEAGQWNTIRIVAQGHRVEHWLNGVKVLEFTRGSAPFTAAVARSKFSKAVPAFGTVAQGHLLLQDHGATVSFRNIKIKTL